MQIKQFVEQLLQQIAERQVAIVRFDEIYLIKTRYLAWGQQFIHKSIIIDHTLKKGYIEKIKIRKIRWNIIW